MTPKSKNILQAFEDYMNANPLPSRTREGASEKTIKGYVHDLNDFLEWWKQTEGETLAVEYLRKDPFALNKKLIQDYVNRLEKKVEISTVLRKVSALRAFVKFLQTTKTIEHEPMHGLRLPRKAELEPRGLSDKQRSRFEAVFQKPWLDTTTKRKGNGLKNLPLRLSQLGGRYSIHSAIGKGTVVTIGLRLVPQAESPLGSEPA